MTWNNNNAVYEPATDSWGGPWTEKKLSAFSKYIWSYLSIMKRYNWKTIYFDGFAGSGSNEKDPKTDLYKQLKINDDEEITYRGSAERVLTLKDNLSFDRYYFIDKNESSLKKLKTKLSQKIDLTNKNIRYISGDANKGILGLSNLLKSNKEFAALVFLDPFGMQIDWSSIESLKDTRSDVWILIPTGVIVNRLLDKAGKLKCIDKLETFFGMPEKDIKDIFYRKELITTLFGEEETISKVSNPIDKIARIYVSRMKTVWKFVTKDPLILYNRKGVPIFHFVFASNNPNALKIAKQIIKGI
jgi:three-Cys-motif partner protein